MQEPIGWERRSYRANKTGVRSQRANRSKVNSERRKEPVGVFLEATCVALHFGASFKGGQGAFLRHEIQVVLFASAVKDWKKIANAVVRLCHSSGGDLAILSLSSNIETTRKSRIWQEFSWSISLVLAWDRLQLLAVGHKLAQQERLDSSGGSVVTSPDRGGRFTRVVFIDN